MVCEVKTAEAGREISWSTIQSGRELVRWRYRFKPADDGTDVAESFEVLWPPPLACLFEDVMMVNRDRKREEAMRATLERIRQTAEASVVE